MVELGEKGKVAVHMRPLTPRRKVRLIRDAFDTLEQTGPEAGIEDDYYFIDLTDEEDIPNAAARLTQRFPNLLALRYDNKAHAQFRHDGFAGGSGGKDAYGADEGAVSVHSKQRNE